MELLTPAQLKFTMIYSRVSHGTVCNSCNRDFPWNVETATDVMNCSMPKLPYGQIVCEDFHAYVQPVGQSLPSGPQ